MHCSTTTYRDSYYVNDPMQICRSVSSAQFYCNVHRVVDKLTIVTMIYVVGKLFYEV